MVVNIIEAVSIGARATACGRLVELPQNRLFARRDCASFSTLRTLCSLRSKLNEHIELGFASGKEEVFGRDAGCEIPCSAKATQGKRDAGFGMCGGVFSESSFLSRVLGSLLRQGYAGQAGFWAHDSR